MLLTPEQVATQALKAEAAEVAEVAEAAPLPTVRPPVAEPLLRADSWRPQPRPVGAKLLPEQRMQGSEELPAVAVTIHLRPRAGLLKAAAIRPVAPSLFLRPEPEKF